MPEAQKAADTDQEIVETPEQALAAQLEGFVEAETSTDTPSETAKAAEPSPTEEEVAKAAQETKAAEEQAAKEAAEKAEQQAAADARQKALDGLSAKDITELVEKSKQFDALRGSLDKMAGKFGSVEQKLKEIAEAKGSMVEMTDEDVADLKSEYGEELAGALLKVFNKFLPKLHGGKAPAQTDAKATDEKTRQEIIDAATAAASNKLDARFTQELNLKLLDHDHKDWRKLIAVYDKDGKHQGYKPEFKAWTDKLPEAEQTRLFSDWDAGFLSEKIGEYKQHLKAVEQAAKDAQAAQDALKQKKTPPATPGRLKSAAVQQGIPGVAVTKTALDEQKEGYGSV